MTPDDVRASRVEWITAYLKADPSLVREVLEGLGLPNYEAATRVYAPRGGTVMYCIVGLHRWRLVNDREQCAKCGAWRLPEEET